MGNQLAARPPSHLTTTEQCLQELPKLCLEKELGSTLLFKVAKAWHKELDKSVVVKAFVIPTDIGLPMDAYKNVLDMYRSNSNRKSNVLCFSEVYVTDRAAFLLRDFVDHSLEVRMNIRPFLTLDEKKWIAFQLLCALHQLHHTPGDDGGGEMTAGDMSSDKSSNSSHPSVLCHGDVKIENILLTDWGWLYLTDIAPFKPAYLPADNPTEFGFFFDIARRQACNLAPERFCTEGNTSTTATSAKDENTLTIQEDTFAAPGTVMGKSKIIARQPLQPSMDMFACGCVFLQLFSDSRRAFSLRELLNYRSQGDLDNMPLLAQVEDKHARELIKMLLQRSPDKRPTAEECLIKHRGKTFPEFFYRFLKNYMKSFLDCDMDTRIMRIRRQMKEIIDQQVVHRDGPSPANGSLVLQVNAITSTIGHLQTEAMKLEALTLLQEFGRYLCSDIVLDRVVPYMVELMQGPHSTSEVRRHALECIAQCVARVKDNIVAADIDFFPEYLLPTVLNVILMRDVGHLEIKILAAHVLPQLAQTALRFLNAAQERRLQPQEEERREIQCYDGELRMLRSLVRDIYVALMTDGFNRVRQVLAQPLAIVRLCDFFGPVESNEAVLSHVVTFLNDKEDVQLRTAFFRMFPSVALFCGAQWTHMLHSLLEFETHDVSEMVAEQCLRCVARLLQVGLLDRDMRRLLMQQAVLPLLAHPSVALRSVAVHVLAQFARHACPAQVYALLLAASSSSALASMATSRKLGEAQRRYLINKKTKSDSISTTPLSPAHVQLYFQPGVRQFTNEYILWCHLKDPIPSIIFQKVLHCGVPLPTFIDFLNKRRAVREMTHSGEMPSYECFTEEKLKSALQTLVRLGLTEEMEDKLCHLHLVLTSQYEHSRNASIPPSTGTEETGSVDSTSTGHPGDGATIAPPVSTASNLLPPCEVFGVQLHPSLFPKFSLTSTLGDAGVASGNAASQQPAAANVEWKHMFTRDAPTPTGSAGLQHANSVTSLHTLGPHNISSLSSTSTLKQVASSATLTSNKLHFGEMEMGHHPIVTNSQMPLMSNTMSSNSNPNWSAVQTYAMSSLQSAISRGHYCPRAVSQHVAENMRFSTVTTSLQHPQYHPQLRAAAATNRGSPATLGSGGGGDILTATGASQSSTLNYGAGGNVTTGGGGGATSGPSLMVTLGAGGAALSSQMWKPKGVLVAHLHEHKVGPVNILNSSNGEFLVSCGLHGEVKVWTMHEQHTKLPTRAQATYRAARDNPNMPEQCRDLVWLMGGSCVATCIDRSRVHVIDCAVGQLHTSWPIASDSSGNSSPRCIALTAPPPYFSGNANAMFDSNSCSPFLPVAGDHFLMYATTQQLIVGQDVRISSGGGAMKSWSTSLDSELGQATSIVMQGGSSWLTVGTSRGYLVTYDLRYRLAISQARHPATNPSAVQKLALHPATLRGEASLVMAAHQYNNEVALWDIENSQRQGVLWASVVPSLSYQKCGAHTVHAMLMGGPAGAPGGTGMYSKLSQGSQALSEGSYCITGGTDARLRYWHLGDVDKSAMVALSGGQEETLNLASSSLFRASYKQRVIDGTLVYEESLQRATDREIETVLRPHQVSNGGHHRPSSSVVRDASHGHSNTITDLALVAAAGHTILVSGSADGVIKFWK